MKKLILYFCILVSTMMSVAHAAKLDKIVFFGDSLTDNGNLYGYLLHVIPKSPPYYEGRFSNGPTWAERVSMHFYKHDYAASSNYAVGGATAVFHMPTSKFIAPTLLEIEVDKYLLDTLFRSKQHTMFMIWIGGNDYLFDADKDADATTSKVVNKISWAIKTLYDHGARHFFVMGLPDLARIPEVIENGNAVQLHHLTVMHNQKLADTMAALRQKYSDIDIGEFDIYNFFETASANLDEFNRTYHTNITNLQDACWKGSIWLSKSISAASLKNEFTRAIEANPAEYAEVDVDALVNLVVNTPALAQTYQLGQSYLRGTVPCANPDNYLFWDHIHPTAVIHQVLGDIIIQKLTPTMHAS